jgi:hypothetical protein
MWSRLPIEPDWARIRIRAAIRDFRQERSIKAEAGLEQGNATKSSWATIVVFL